MNEVARRVELERHASAARGRHADQPVRVVDLVQRGPARRVGDAQEIPLAGVPVARAPADMLAVRSSARRHPPLEPAFVVVLQPLPRAAAALAQHDAVASMAQLADRPVRRGQLDRAVVRLLAAPLELVEQPDPLTPLVPAADQAFAVAQVGRPPPEKPMPKPDIVRFGPRPSDPPARVVVEVMLPPAGQLAPLDEVVVVPLDVLEDQLPIAIPLGDEVVVLVVVVLIPDPPMAADGGEPLALVVDPPALVPERIAQPDDLLDRVVGVADRVAERVDLRAQQVPRGGLLSVELAVPIEVGDLVAGRVVAAPTWPVEPVDLVDLVPERVARATRLTSDRRAPEAPHAKHAASELAQLARDLEQPPAGAEHGLGHGLDRAGEDAVQRGAREVAREGIAEPRGLGLGRVHVPEPIATADVGAVVVVDEGELAAAGVDVLEDLALGVPHPQAHATVRLDDLQEEAVVVVVELLDGAVTLDVAGEVLVGEVLDLGFPQAVVAAGVDAAALGVVAEAVAVAARVDLPGPAVLERWIPFGVVVMRRS